MTEVTEHQHAGVPVATAALIAPAGTPAATARNPLRDPRDRRLPRVPEPCALVVFGETEALSGRRIVRFLLSTTRLWMRP